MNTTYTAIVKIEAGGAVANLDEIDKAVKSSNSNLIAMRKELKSVQSELLALEPGSAAFNKLASRAGELRDRMNDVSEQINANAGPALESIGNQAGLLQSKLMNLDIAGVGESFSALGSNIRRVSFKDMQAGLQGVTKGLADMGRALLANPIFLLGAVLVGLITYSKELNEALDFTAKNARKLAESSLAAADASKKAGEAFALEERKLRALGVAEEEISAQRTSQRANELKKLKQAFEDQQAVVEIAVKNFRANRLSGRKQEFLEVVNAEAAKRDAILLRIQEIAVIELEGRKKERDAKAEADQKALEEEQAAADRLKAEKERRSEEEIKRIAEEERLILEEREKVRKEFEERLALEEAKIQEVKAEQQAGQLAQSNQLLVDQYDAEKRAADARVELSRQEFDAKLEIAQSFTSAASSLNELLVATGLVSAKKGFQIAKGIAIAEGTISTIRGVLSTMADPTLIPYPLKLATAIGVGIAGAANVAKIAKTQFNGGGGGGGVGGGTSLPTPSAGGGSSLAPAFNPLNTQFLANRPPQQPSVRAYVVANDVASEEEASEKINALSTL